MMEKMNYMTARAFAMEYGTFLGGAWTLVFAIYIMGIRAQSSLLLLLAMGLICVLPFVAFYFAYRLGRSSDSGTSVSFGTALMFSFMMFLYASLLTGLAQFIYFQFMDDGLVVEQLYEMFLNKQTVEVYNSLGMGEMLKVAEAQLDELAQMSALDIAMLLFNQNIFLGLVLSVPTSFFAKRR